MLSQYSQSHLPRVAILQLDPAVPAGLLEHAGTVVAPGQPLPLVDELDALIVLGGRQDAYDPDLAGVRDLLGRAVEARLPTLAICLGAQMLAVAGGGAVQVDAPSGPEQGIFDVRLRPGAEADPVLGPVMASLGRDVRAVEMHADAVTRLPDGAAWLASSVRCPYQAFRVGSALGVQFHPEPDAAGYGELLHDQAGGDAAAGQAQWETQEPQLRALADLMLEGLGAMAPAPAGWGGAAVAGLAAGPRHQGISAY